MTNTYDVYREHVNSKALGLWNKALLKISHVLNTFGFKLVCLGKKVYDKVPVKYKPYDGNPEYPVGPPVMDDSVKDSLEELLADRKDKEFVAQIKDDPCEIPPIKRGGCEIQTGNFRRVSCLEETK
jgi:hypothetical protein